jgi:hypothetical protein
LLVRPARASCALFVSHDVIGVIHLWAGLGSPTSALVNGRREGTRLRGCAVRGRIMHNRRRRNTSPPQTAVQGWLGPHTLVSWLRDRENCGIQEGAPAISALARHGRRLRRITTGKTVPVGILVFYHSSSLAYIFGPSVSRLLLAHDVSRILPRIRQSLLS